LHDFFREFIVDQKQIIYNYQKNCFSPEEAREALFRAAVAANEENWTYMDTIFQLGDKALEDGLDRETIEQTIRKAFARERRGRDRRSEAEDTATRGRLDLDAESRQLLESRRIDPDALAIPWPSDDWRRDLIKLLSEAFNPKDVIEFKLAGTPETHRETVENILSQEAIITKIMKNLDGEDGALIGINAVASGNARDDSWRFRYALVDSQRMNLSKQLAFYKALNLPCIALINSGANTAQAWVRIEAADAAEYTERVDYLYNILEENGFKADHSLKSPNQLARMPGVLRQGKQQYLIGLNEGAKNWKEWKEWVEYCLDGNPLVELASYHTHVPTPDETLVEEVLRCGHFLILTGPRQCGKSLTLIDLALSLCYGVEWMGNHTNDSDVLYVNFDLTKAAFLQRLRAVAAQRELEPATARLGILHLRGFTLSATEMAEFLIRRVEGARKYEQRKYQTIILDPAMALLCNISPAELQQMINAIIARTGSAIVMACTPQEFEAGAYQPDALLELRPVENRPNAFQLFGSFKEFPPLSPRECWWKYPHFICNP